MATYGILRNRLHSTIFQHALTWSKSKHMRCASSWQKTELDTIDESVDSDIRLSPFDQIEGTHQKFLENIRPPLKRSFNLAAYVNVSETLRELIKIGVSLYDIENLKPEAAKHLLQLDYKRDCVKYFKFLTDNGLKPRNIGRFVSEFPEIFQLPIIELQSRFDYLSTKNFSHKQIVRALNKSSYILSQQVKTLDYKLGEFQIEFRMPADFIRESVSKYPPILAHPIHQYKLVNFCLSEEFGFNTAEIHKILEQQPKIIDLLRPKLASRLDFIHNTMKLSHSVIVQFPKLITGPELDIKHRFLYLQKLKRDQFDPKKPLYVRPSALYNGSDAEFCEKYAKTNLDDYKLFMKMCI